MGTTSAPTNATLSIQGCDSEADCDAALKALPPILRAASEAVEDSIVTLDSLEPPAKYREFHDSYRRMLELRVEAFGFYVEGAESRDDNLFAKGNEIWYQAQDIRTDIANLLVELYEDTSSLSEEGTWMLQYLDNVERARPSLAAAERAISRLLYCQTDTECNRAYFDLPVVLRPANDSLKEAFANLDLLQPPENYVRLQSSYEHLLELRIKAHDFYIEGVEQNDVEKINDGDEQWQLSLKAAEDYVSATQELLSKQ